MGLLLADTRVDVIVIHHLYMCRRDDGAKVFGGLVGISFPNVEHLYVVVLKNHQA